MAPISGYIFPAVRAAAPTLLTYDADGNLLSDGEWNYTWDGENRLYAIVTTTAAETAGYPAMGITFTYDYAGRMAKAGWNACETHFFYDGTNIIAEMDFVDNYPTLERTYAWGPDLSGTLHGAGGVGGLLMGNLQTQEVDGGEEYDPQWTRVGYGFSSNGDVALLASLDDEQGVVARYDYSPFGETVQELGPVARFNPMRFSTKRALMQNGHDGVLLPDLGLVLYLYRVYHPGLGRFLSTDPIWEEGGVNLYAFCNNDSVNSYDPLGEDVKRPNEKPPKKVRERYGPPNGGRPINHPPSPTMPFPENPQPRVGGSGSGAGGAIEAIPILIDVMDAFRGIDVEDKVRALIAEAELKCKMQAMANAQPRRYADISKPCVSCCEINIYRRMAVQGRYEESSNWFGFGSNEWKFIPPSGAVMSVQLWGEPKLHLGVSCDQVESSRSLYDYMQGTLQTVKSSTKCHFYIVP